MSFKRNLLILYATALFFACKTEHPFSMITKSSDTIIIDGITNEKTWQNIPWLPIDQVWLGNPISQDDFSGKYKLSWSEDALYVLVTIKDNVLLDRFENPLERWWDEDCVEIFIDEDNSGGNHQFNHNAFAYHIDLKGNVVDIIAKDTPKLFNDHIKSKRVTSGDTSIWEFKISLFPDTFVYGQPTQNISLHDGEKNWIRYCLLRQRLQ